jgi:hypothetical protein
LRSQFRAFILIFVILILSGLLLGGLGWVNSWYMESNTVGLTYMANWFGSRALLLEGISPYADDVAKDAQQEYYQRQARPGEVTLRVATPVWNLFFYAPFALIEDLKFSQSIWLIFAETLILIMAVLSLLLSRWRLGLFSGLIYFVFALTWYPLVIALIEGSTIILTGVFLTASFLTIRQERDDWGGFFLGMAMLHPQSVIFVLFFVILWALTNNRWKIIFWSIGTIIILSMIGFVFVPVWSTQYIFALIETASFTTPGTPGDILIKLLPGVGQQLGWGITIFFSLLLIYEWVVASGKGYQWFLWTGCLTITVTPLIGIRMGVENLVVLFPPLIYLVASLESRWGRNARLYSMLTLILISLVTWSLYITAVNRILPPIVSPELILPIPLVIIAGLYWIRWWAVRQQRSLVELMKVL